MPSLAVCNASENQQLRRVALHELCSRYCFKDTNTLKAHRCLVVAIDSLCFRESPTNAENLQHSY